MTEAEWLFCTDPEKMLVSLQGWSSERRFQFFTCAVIRRIWDLLEAGPKRDVILLAEKYIDDEYDKLGLLSKSRNAWGEEGYPFWSDVYFYFTYGEAHRSAVLVEKEIPKRHRLDLEESCRLHLGLIHCVFGNPFRPVTFAPEWRTDTVLTLARQMYDSRDFSAMPILADALQDAGCEEASILDHCRGPGPHVRGCWVVDLVLGKQ